jgi:hypothetical protein
VNWKVSLAEYSSYSVTEIMEFVNNFFNRALRSATGDIFCLGDSGAIEIEAAKVGKKKGALRALFIYACRTV